jgi:ParB family chromosome partitioning protein
MIDWNFVRQDIAGRMKAAGLSQRALADKAGVDQASLSRFLAGRNAQLAVDTLDKIAGAIGSVGSGGAPAGGEDGALVYLTHAQLVESLRNPRKDVDDDALGELASSIETHGVLQNLVVGKPGTNGVHCIVSGARRWRAIGMLLRARRSIDGVSAAAYRIPCRVVDDFDPVETMVLAVTENLQRQDLTPMEEAEAFGWLRKNGGWSTERIADLVHKTQRFVQRRLALVEKLAPPVKEALRQGEINFMQAEAMTLATGKEQTEVLEHVKAGYVHWQSADQIRRNIISDKHPLSRAFFKRELYDGDFIAGDDGEPAWFADSAQFERLQRAAAAAKLEALRKQWAWAEIYDGTKHEYFRDYDYTRSKSRKVAGAVVTIGYDLTVSVKTGYVKPAPKAGKTAEDKPARHFTDTHLRLARRLKTMALQDAVLKNTGAVLRLAVIGLMGASEVRIEPSAGDSNGNAGYGPATMAAHKAAYVRLGGTLDDVERNPTPLHRAVRPSLHTWHDKGRLDPVAVWRRLNDLSDSEVLQILAALVAGNTGSWNDHAAALGDSDLVATLAKDLGVSMAAIAKKQLRDDAYLKSAGKPHLIEIARDLGYCDKPSDTAKQIREAIADSLIPSMSDYVPRELRFGRDAYLPHELAERDRQAAEEDDEAVDNLCDDEDLDEQEDAA